MLETDTRLKWTNKFKKHASELTASLEGVEHKSEEGEPKGDEGECISEKVKNLGDKLKENNKGK